MAAAAWGADSTAGDLRITGSTACISCGNLGKEINIFISATTAEVPSHKAFHIQWLKQDIMLPCTVT